VGYKIIGPAKSALFIPDIDKWSKWESNIIEEIASVDFAFIDGTFYDAEEINNRDISEIPHPFIIETMELLKNLKKQEKNKVYFIHLNHTNPALNEKSKAYQTIKSKGFNIAELQTVFALY
jgi:pyrroloquinoline quinone biosynthesis protein B